MEQTSEPGREEADAACIAAFCAGDLEALTAIFDRYAGPVKSVAMTILHDGALADDATQETFLRAWKSSARFDPARPLAPWLFTIARRTSIDVHRRESRPTRGGHVEQQDIEVVEPGIEQAWTAWEVRCALDELTVEERDVLKLAYFGGLTHPQIAAHLNVPIGTVKSRSSRAHKRVAALLGHLDERVAPELAEVSS